jgi:hypothetical protein
MTAQVCLSAQVLLLWWAKNRNPRNQPTPAHVQCRRMPVKSAVEPSGFARGRTVITSQKCDVLDFLV